MNSIIYRNYVFESVDIPDLLYHGSVKLFDKFELGYSEFGENLQKYGYGIYLTNTFDLAEYYSNDNYVYLCKISRSLNLISWDDLISEDLYLKITEKLFMLGYESDAERLTEDFESYNETISCDSMYNIVKDVSDIETTNKIFTDCGIDGFTANDIHDRGLIYVILDPSKIKILKVINTKESEEIET